MCHKLDVNHFGHKFKNLCSAHLLSSCRGRCKHTPHSNPPAEEACDGRKEGEKKTNFRGAGAAQSYFYYIKVLKAQALSTRCFIALCYRFVVVYGIYDDIRVIQSQMNCLCVEPHCHWNMMFAEYHGFMWESRTLEPNTQNQHSHTPNSHYRFDKTKSMTKFVHEH